MAEVKRLVQTMTERASIAIPEELLDQVERGNVLLFVGERIARDPSGQPTPDRITLELAARLGSSPDDDLTFLELAQQYEDEQGRHALVQFMRDQLEELGDDPQPAHHLIAQLTQCDVLATTALNRRLERAFTKIGRSLQVIISPKDVVFEDERNAQLYKLRGTIDQVDSLILTEDDHERFFEDQDSISVILQGYLARKTLLFIGYDLDDPRFKRLHRKVTARLDGFTRRSYAFGESPPARISRWCQRNGISVVEASATVFLTALHDRLAARIRTTTTPLTPLESTAPQDSSSLPRNGQTDDLLQRLLRHPLPAHPYKRLDYYEAADALFFYGRRQEIFTLSALIHAHRLTLLYGASGVGKTSLLLAGVLPRLEQADPPYATIYTRALDDPILAIRRAVRRRLPDMTLPDDVPLIDLLDAAMRVLGHPLVLALDQYEELFIRHSIEARAAFADELGKLCEARDLPVKVVLSLREDWLAAINEFERRVPEIFHNRMRVLPLARTQAREAIVAPVERLGVRYEPELVGRLLDNLAGEEGATILPPQLQLVGSALYDRRATGERLITLASYEQLNGAQGILQTYLEDELARLSHADRLLARATLAELVTSQATKAVKTADELAQALQVERVRVAAVLEMLVRARLLRALSGNEDNPVYELAHEYLIRDIDMSPEAQQRKEAEELLRQGLDNWRRFGILLSEEAHALIEAQRLQLHLGAEAEDLIRRSAARQARTIERVGLSVVGGLLGGVIGGTIAAIAQWLLNPPPNIGFAGLLFGTIFGAGVLGAGWGLGAGIGCLVARRRSLLSVLGGLVAGIGLSFLGYLVDKNIGLAGLLLYGILSGGGVALSVVLGNMQPRRSWRIATWALLGGLLGIVIGKFFSSIWLFVPIILAATVDIGLAQELFRPFSTQRRATDANGAAATAIRRNGDV
jgi:hypothetical protein